MKFLYLLLDLGTILVPFIFSFHPKLKFYHHFSRFFPAALITMLIFIPWDVIFTSMGVWGFNDDYITGLKIWRLPLEEWLFFICIPFACVFTYFCLKKLYPEIGLTFTFTQRFAVSIIILCAICLLFYADRAYTFYNALYGVFLLAYATKYHLNCLRYFFPVYVVLLIPFLIVNGILTGTLLENPVVWYNNDENMGVRVFTVPIEDFLYAFTLILSTLVFMEVLQRLLPARK